MEHDPAPLTDTELACAPAKQLYARLLVEVTSHYRGQPNGWRRCVAEINRRAGVIAETAEIAGCALGDK